MKRALLAVLILTFLALAIPAFAQTVPVAPSKSGMVAYFDGSVYLDEQALTDPLVSQYPYMKENGTIRCTEQGRAEIMMNPGITVRIGEGAKLKMLTNRFIDTRVELMAGSAMVQVVEVGKDNAFTMVDGSATLSFPKAGSYHVDFSPGRVKVFSGAVSVAMAGHTVEVSAGKMLSLTGDLASIERFSKEDTDSLDRWAMERGELAATANASVAREVIYRGRNNYPCFTGALYAVSSVDPCVGQWTWNPWYGFYTYIPFRRYCDPWAGYCYEDPRSVMSYYRPPVISMPSNGGGGMGGYSSPAGTSGGYSGTAAAVSSSVSSSPSAGTGSSAAAATASSSVGQGSSGGGGHSK
jgi:hypothetical protein